MGKKEDQRNFHPHAKVIQRPKPNQYHLVLENKNGRRIAANFGLRKIQEGGSSRTFLPLFNYGSSQFAPAFVCENTKVRKKD